MDAANLHIQVVPLTHTEQAFPIIDDVIALIAHAGFTYEVGPFGTSVEGPRVGLQQLVADIQEQLTAAGCTEWLLNLQWHERPGHQVTAQAKTAKHRQPGR